MQANKALLLLVAVALVYCVAARPSLSEHHLRIRADKQPSGEWLCEITHDEEAQHRIVQQTRRVHLQKTPRHIEDDADHDVDQVDQWMWSVFAPSRKLALSALDELCSSVSFGPALSASSNTDDVFRLVTSGPSDNRIDVVFMGDGYTEHMKDMFLGDMQRLTDDMFNAVTFHSYLPLFNIWAVFRASVDAGIGKNSQPKDTAYGLYRDGTELRGIYCSKPNDAIDSCKHTGPHACDYPTLIGNNPFYGGLGGEFSISTKSKTSGIVVLRHEFGHSMGNVGEEYDSGMHFGANVAYSMDAVAEKWGPWLTSPPPEPEQSQQRIQDYSWYLLENGPYTLLFDSDGEWDRWMMKFSVSGCKGKGSLKIYLDEKLLQWETHDLLDRSFYTYYSEDAFSAGTHNLTFVEGYAPEYSWPHRQLCSVNLIEYKNSPQFTFNNTFVSAYPTFNNNNKAHAFRSQNERCLMRNMSSNEFCHADKENLWLQLLARVSLIDDLTAQCIDGSNVTIALSLVPLGQFRTDGQVPGEYYTVEWTQNGKTIPDMQDMTVFTLPPAQAVGAWEAKVQFHTNEVRSDPQQLLLNYDRVFVASDVCQ